MWIILTKKKKKIIQPILFMLDQTNNTLKCICIKTFYSKLSFKITRKDSKKM